MKKTNMGMTIYNPAIHGKMTDDERRAYNAELLRSLPKENLDDMMDKFDYDSYMAVGNYEEADKCKAGHDRYIVCMETRKEIFSRLLVSEKEAEELDLIFRNSSKAVRKEFLKKGVFLTERKMNNILGLFM